MAKDGGGRLVVTGASGKVGRVIAARLAGAGRAPVLLVRDAARAPALHGASVVVADFRDGDSIRAALRAGDRVFMVSVHESVPDRIAAHESFVAAAAAADVGLVAYLSMVNPSPTAAFPHGRSHHATEVLVREAGLPHAFLRMNLFLDDLPLWFDGDGVCRGPGGDGRVSLVSRADVAAVAAAVLADPSHDGEALDVTGEESATLGALAAVCAEGLGRPFAYEPGSREDWIAGRIAAGRKRWDAEAGCGCYDAVRLGEVDVVSDVVRRIGGVVPERPRGFVAAHPERFDLLGVAARAARGARV
jgi:NAD(P)H dehydrogenase (quinone)